MVRASEHANLVFGVPHSTKPLRACAGGGASMTPNTSGLTIAGQMKRRNKKPPMVQCTLLG